MNQKRGRQGSHSAQVPNTILPNESDMLACITNIAPQRKQQERQEHGTSAKVLWQQ